MGIEERIDTAVVFDTSRLDELLTFLGDDGSMIVGEILAAYLAAAPRLVARINDGRATGNLVTIRDAAHTLKSASTNVGAIALGQLCDLTERVARHGDAEMTIEHSDAIGDLYVETVRQIESWWT